MVRMKIALINVKPVSDDYIAKEMAGGLGKRLKLKNTFYGRLLNWGIKSRFNAPPILLAQLAGIARLQNHDVDAYYTNSPEEINCKTDIAIVLSSMVDYRNECRFLQKLKASHSKIKIVVVGSFASAMPEIYQSFADYVVCGDPEIAIQEFCKQRFPRSQLLQSQEVLNLNKLPMLDWTPFIKKGLFARRPFSKELGVSIQKSRGCSMTCNYCPYSAFFGKTKHFDNTDVMKTIRYYYDHFNIRYFMFRDPNFGENKKEFHSFMKVLLESDLNISWSCEARLDIFNQEDLQLMCRAGLRYIIIGIESSNRELLRVNTRVTIVDDIL